jgi:hypothetical protein
MGTPSMGWQAQFALDASTFDTNSEAYDIQGETISNENQLIEPNGMRGTRSRFGGNVVEGQIGPVQGGFTLYPTPTMFDRLLPRILGADEAATDIFAVAETIPEFNIMVDRVAKVHTYAGCKINTATLSSAPGDLLTLSVDILGKTETLGDAATFPAITPPDEDPYRHFDSSGQVTIFSAVREIKRSTITISNALIPIFNNSQTAAYIREGDRIVDWVVELPFTSSEIDLLAGDVTGTTGSIKYVVGNKSFLVTFGKLHIPKQRPTGIQRGSEIVYPVRMRALWDGSTREIVVTNDITG